MKEAGLELGFLHFKIDLLFMVKEPGPINLSIHHERIGEPLHGTFRSVGSSEVLNRPLHKVNTLCLKSHRGHGIFH